jgi:hypothetical protein
MAFCERLSWSRLALFGSIAAYTLGGPLAMAGLGAEAPADRGIAQAPITLAEQPTAQQPSPEQQEATQALDQAEASLAQQLANPVAALVSIPFQWN